MKQLSLIAIGPSKPHGWLRLTSVLIILFLQSATTQAQSLIPELSFKHPVLKTGRGCVGDGLDGAVYIFDNVGWGIDAMITILGRSSVAVSLSEADMEGPEQDSTQGTGDDNAWQPRIKYADGNAPPHQNWWMEFKISFVKKINHEEELPVKQFLVTGFDIDGDGNQLHEFQLYYKMKSFSLERQTAVFASSAQGSESDPLLNGKRFDGSTKNYPGISMSAEDAIVNNFYTGTSSMIVRLGAETGSVGTISANRMYALLFKSLVYDVPVVQKPVVSLVALNVDQRLIEKE
jgi:hypothetical protein